MNAHQMRYLQSALNTPIVCNQLEMSLTQTRLAWKKALLRLPASSTLGTARVLPSKYNIEIQAWGSLSQGLFSGREI